jgi:hypothetical protein
MLAALYPEPADSSGRAHKRTLAEEYIGPSRQSGRTYREAQPTSR